MALNPDPSGSSQVVRFRRPGSVDVEVGLRSDDGLLLLDVPDVATLLAGSLDAMRERLAEATRRVHGPVRLLAPIDGRTEVWAAGVTYERSRDCRTEESAEPTIYDRVYSAERPELFYKAAAWRVVGDGAPIGIRSDTPTCVPEPELAVVVNPRGEVVGLTICNDVTARSLEAENPLYLPQAKLFAGSCALGPGIVPAWAIEDLRSLWITVEVRRGDKIVWEGQVGADQLHREIRRLIASVTAPADFPDGLVLSTGTGLVPDLDFALVDSDIVTVRIDRLGTLTNRVVRGRAAWRLATERAT